MRGNVRKRICGFVAIIGLAMLCGCNKVPENTVFSLDDLKGKKIGVQLKTTGDIYASEIEGAQVQRFNKGKDAVAALQAGELDAVMLDDGPAEVFINEFENIRILEECYAEEEYGLVVKKGNTELLDKINAALGKIKENGILDSITQNWIYDGATQSAYQRQKEDSYANGKLVVVTNAEFPPYESVVDDEVAGFDIDLMKAICDELDMELEVQNIAFDSVISAVDRGIADVGATAMSITDERQDQVDFSIPYITAKQVILVRDNNK